jgi:molybdate transport system substrate-binding protein
MKTCPWVAIGWFQANITYVSGKTGMLIFKSKGQYMRRNLLFVFLQFVLLISIQAAEVTVAVASNFSLPMRKIAAQFEVESGHKVRLSFGSTGALYAQIKNGGPFHLLIAADQEAPARLEKEGLGIAGTRFTYAQGRLVLWSRQAGLVDKEGEILTTGQFQKLALANPKLAPYGLAAMETLRSLSLTKQLKPKLVQGENISQAYQFVETENAQIGFVAMSQVFSEGKLLKGSAWIVPPQLYSPIHQDAILLLAGQKNSAATELMRYLKTDQAKSVMSAYGYSHRIQ